MVVFQPYYLYWGCILIPVVQKAGDWLLWLKKVDK